MVDVARNAGRVQVLLSTYNGVRYLRPLMESLLRQDYPWVEVLSRGDGSDDGTLDVLREYAAAYDRISVTSGDRLGPTWSFFRLLEQSSSDAGYIAFCDQDDIWRSDKTARGVMSLSQHPREVSVLYFSRLAVVDENSGLLSCADVPRKALSFRNALVENPVRGCAMMLNQAARRLLLTELPRKQTYPYGIDYDWWTYLVVSAFGRVVYDREPTIFYRRHASNFSSFPLMVWGKWIMGMRRFLRYGRVHRLVNQIEELRRIYAPMLPDENRGVLERLLESRRRLRDRLRYVLRPDVYRHTISDDMILKVLIILDRL